MDFKSFENSYILLNNFNEKKDNKILILSDHSASSFPGEIQVSDNDDLLEIFKKKLHYDENSLEVSKYLNNEFNSILVINKFSHLLCDPCLKMNDKNLIPLNLKNFELKFNKLSFKEQERRISNYYVGFHISLRYLQINYHFDYVITIHSHHEENYDFIIEYYFDDEFSKSIIKYLTEEKFKILLNKKDFKESCNVNNEILLSNTKRKGILISFLRYIKNVEQIIKRSIDTYFKN